MRARSVRTIPFQLVNVFAESVFGGNPLAVIEDASALEEGELLPICRQFNLSETTFVYPSAAPADGAFVENSAPSPASRTDAFRVRIFSPDGEMAFAGHPTLGTAAVIGGGRDVALELPVGRIPVTALGEDRRELRAKLARFRPAPTDAQMSEMLGLSPGTILEGPRYGRATWSNNGTEQLLVPLRSLDALHGLRPSLELLARFGANASGRVGVYVFAFEDEFAITSRYFWVNQGELREDPGTGSAAANLGAWLREAGHSGVWQITQGHATGRLNHVQLRISPEEREIFVAGRVVSVGRGALTLPASVGV
jgi:trans-2,3-dihydro-3-hydroxyanthranilate isomerase